MHTHTHTYKYIHIYQGYQSSAFRRNSNFFFFISVFLNMIFPLFLKIAPPPPPEFFFFVYRHCHYGLFSKNFGKQSVMSCFALHSGAVSPLGTPTDPCSMALQLTLVAMLRVGIQHLRPSLSTLITLHTHTHTHTHSLSLSLSLSHTHTHTHIQGCQLLQFRHGLPWSVLTCYARTRNATVT